MIDDHKIYVSTRRFELEPVEGCGKRQFTFLSSLLIATNASALKDSLHLGYGADSFVELKVILLGGQIRKASIEVRFAMKRTKWGPANEL